MRSQDPLGPPLENSRPSGLGLGADRPGSWGPVAVAPMQDWFPLWLSSGQGLPVGLDPLGGHL